MGRSFHHPGTVNENVLESDFEPLCDGTTRRRSLGKARQVYLYSTFHTQKVIQSALHKRK